MKPLSAFFQYWLNDRVLLLISGLIVLAGLALSLAGVVLVSPWLRIIVGLLVFILPGAYLFSLAPARDDWDLIDCIGYGFTFSVALITVLGLFTRTLRLHINTVELIWHALALLGFAAVLWRARGRTAIKLRCDAAIAALLAIILVQVALYAHSSILATPTTDDQNRHHAAVNGFLRDEPLGWAEPYYETGNPIADRMYFTYWVLAQALVVEISGTTILLARYLVNPFVMLMSVAGMYVFARNLNHSRKASLVYVCLGLFAYSLVAQIGPQPGSQFFARGLLDKAVAAFALAPIAISSAYQYITTGNRRTLFAFVLSFLATACVHAIAGGFAVCIIAGYAVITFVVNRAARMAALHLLLLMMLLFSPAIFTRLNTADTSIYHFEDLPETGGNTIHMYDAANPLDNGNSFYAIHPVLAGSFTYILVALTVVAVLARRLDPRSRLMLAFALAIGFGLLPFTAWIYGRVVSFYHVVRVLWLMPYGYMLGYVIETGITVARRARPSRLDAIGRLGNERALLPLMAVAAILTGHFLQFSPRANVSGDLATATSGDAELLEIGEYVEATHDDRVWFAASPESRSRAMTLSWKVIELSRFTAERMSYYSNMPQAQAESQLSDNLRLYDGDTPVEEKLAIVDRYGIDYLLFPKGYAWMIDALYQTDKERFELVFSGETYRLVRVK